MPPARRSTTKKAAARASSATKSVRARAASTKQATRREVEQSISRVEKRLDDANDALKTLGTHLGRGSSSSYKEVTATLTALRREVAKTNKQALKDFDKLRAALVQKTPAASRSNSRSKASSSATKKSSGSSRSTASKRSTTKSSSAKRSTAKSSTAKSSTAKSSGSRSKSTRARKTS